MPMPPQNLLATETSPYLRQHSENPVHWRAWSPAALAEARALDRPILLSVGYAACHWCHVMAHESFENEAVASVMNRHFINIKVDREERPDIDQIYMAALSAMGEQGGWPLTMFLTPQGKPFFGGTYYPPEPRYGRPGFGQILEAVAKAWDEKKADLAESADGLIRHVEARLAGTHPKGTLDPGALASLADGVYGMIDMQAGGLRGAPKFPNAPFMQTLWMSWLKTGNVGHRDAVLVSLEKMLGGGIYDHIGGGLSRYSTDAAWLVPHFEKMLYDNAQLLRLCNWAYAQTGNDLFRIRIEETVDWLFREMRVEGGAFASSLDADSDGEEGLFYTWTRSKIDAVLGNDSGLLFKYLTLSAPGGWEGDPILHQTDPQRAESAHAQAELAPLKTRLLAVRERRVRPARDDKVLADWNGLMIAAFAETGRALGRPDWIAAAETAFASIAAAGEGGRLPHSMLGGQKLFPALSSDYAAMIHAAVRLFEATANRQYIANAQQFLNQLDRWHGDAEKTGYYLTASDSADVPMRIRGDVDEAVPSATSQIIEALSLLSTLTGDEQMARHAGLVAEHAAGRASKQAYGQAGIVNACALVIEPLKLVMVENPPESGLVTVANRNADPRRVDVFIPIGTVPNLPVLPGGALPPTDRAGAYLCTGQMCLPAISDPVELEAKLRRT